MTGGAPVAKQETKNIRGPQCEEESDTLSEIPSEHSPNKFNDLQRFVEVKLGGN